MTDPNHPRKYWHVDGKVLAAFENACKEDVRFLYLKNTAYGGKTLLVSCLQAEKLPMESIIQFEEDGVPFFIRPFTVGDFILFTASLQ